MKRAEEVEQLNETLQSLRVAMPGRHESEELADRLRRFNQLTLVGGVFLLFALVASMFLVFDFLFGRVAGVSMAAAIGLICAACWYGLPLLRKGRMGETNGAERR